MSIKQVFKQHFKLVFNDKGQRECQCGFFIGNGDNAGKLHKKHAIQVLEQHEREAKAEALEEAARSTPVRWDFPPHASALEIRPWLRDRAAQIRKETRAE